MSQRPIRVARAGVTAEYLLLPASVIGCLVAGCGIVAGSFLVGSAVWTPLLSLAGAGTAALSLAAPSGAMQAPLVSPRDLGAQTPLARWSRHGAPSLARMGRIGRLGRGETALTDRPAEEDVERPALVRVVQRTDHVTAHRSVSQRTAEGSRTLHGPYLHVGEARTRCGVLSSGPSPRCVWTSSAPHDPSIPGRRRPRRVARVLTAR